VVVVDHEERNRDGDVVYWELKPVQMRGASPTSKPFTVTLYND